MENDRSFYERRLREEMARSANESTEGLRALHCRWAELYRIRLTALRCELEHQSIGVADTSREAVTSISVTPGKSRRHSVRVQEAKQAARTGNLGPRLLESTRSVLAVSMGSTVQDYWPEV